MTHRVSAISLLCHFHVDAMQEASRNKRDVQCGIRKCKTRHAAVDRCSLVRNNFRHLCGAFDLLSFTFNRRDVKLGEKASHSLAGAGSIFCLPSPKKRRLSRISHSMSSPFSYAQVLRSRWFCLRYFFLERRRFTLIAAETRVECKSAQIGEGERVRWLPFYFVCSRGIFAKTLGLGSADLSDWSPHESNIFDK